MADLQSQRRQYKERQKMLRQQNGPGDETPASLDQAEQMSQNPQPHSQQTSAFVSPFKQKYLSRAVLDSATPGGVNKHAEMPPTSASNNKLRSFALPKSATQDLSKESPTKDEDLLQSPPENEQKATPSKNWGKNRHDLSSGRKSTEMLHENNFQSLKDQIAEVKSKLPGTIPSRSGTGQRYDSAKRMLQATNDKPMSKDKQRSASRSSAGRGRQSMSSAGRSIKSGVVGPQMKSKSQSTRNLLEANAPPTEVELPKPGADRSWTSQPLNILTAQKVAQKKAQKLFVPKNIRKSRRSTSNARSISEISKNQAAAAQPSKDAKNPAPAILSQQNNVKESHPKVELQLQMQTSDSEAPVDMEVLNDINHLPQQIPTIAILESNVKPKRTEVVEPRSWQNPDIQNSAKQMDFKGSSAKKTNEIEPAALQSHTVGLNRSLRGDEKEQAEYSKESLIAASSRSLLGFVDEVGANDLGESELQQEPENEDDNEAQPVSDPAAIEISETWSLTFKDEQELEPEAINVEVDNPTSSEIGDSSSGEHKIEDELQEDPGLSLIEEGHQDDSGNFSSILSPGAEHPESSPNKLPNHVNENTMKRSLTLVAKSVLMQSNAKDESIEVLEETRQKSQIDFRESIKKVTANSEYQVLPEEHPYSFLQPSGGEETGFRADTAEPNIKFNMNSVDGSLIKPCKQQFKGSRDFGRTSSSRSAASEVHLQPEQDRDDREQEQKLMEACLLRRHSPDEDKETLIEMMPPKGRQETMTPHEQQDNKLEFKFQELLMQYRLGSPKTQDAHRDQESWQPKRSLYSNNQEEVQLGHEEVQPGSSMRRSRKARSRSPHGSKAASLHPLVISSQQASNIVSTLQPMQEETGEVVKQERQLESNKNQFIRALLSHVPPPAKKMTQNQLQQFLERQAKHESKRIRRLEKVIEVESQKIEKDLKFQPEITKKEEAQGQLPVVSELRPFDSFLRDQMRFKSTNENRIAEALREKRRVEEQALLKKTFVSANSRKILAKRAQMTRSKSKSEDSDTSFGPMDEGTRVLSRDIGAFNSCAVQIVNDDMNDSFEDMQEHPRQSLRLKLQSNFCSAEFLNPALPLKLAGPAAPYLNQLPDYPSVVNIQSQQQRTATGSLDLQVLAAEPPSNSAALPTGERQVSTIFEQINENLQSNSKRKKTPKSQLLKPREARSSKEAISTSLRRPSKKDDQTSIANHRNSTHSAAARLSFSVHAKQRSREAQARIGSFLLKNMRPLGTSTIENTGAVTLFGPSNNNKELDSKPAQKIRLISKQTDKILLNKFNKEFTNTVQSILGVDKLPMTINSYAFSQLAIELGCAKQADMQNDDSAEFKRVEEIWHCLLEVTQPLSTDPAAPQMVQVGDAKVFFMAVFGVRGNRRVGLQNPLADPLAVLPYGWLNENNQLCLSEKCVDQIHSKFQILNANRTLTQNAKRLDKPSNPSPKSLFKPELTAQKMNHKILQERKRLDSLNKDVLTISTVLRARSVAKDYKMFIETQNSWRNHEQDIQSKAVVAECTFTPNIKKTSKKFRSNNTYIPTSYMTQPNPGNAQEQQLLQHVLGLEKKSRFDQLYTLSKVKDQRQQHLASKTQEDKDFEVQAKECTFKPTMIARLVVPSQSATTIASSSLLPRPRLLNQMPAKYDMNEQDVDAARRISSPKRKPADKISDLRQALKEKYKMQPTAMKKKNEPPTTKAELLERINASTARLSMPRKQSVSKPQSERPHAKPSPNLEEKSPKPLLYIDIDIGDGSKDRITVFEPNSAKLLASDFCQKHEFDQDTQDILEQQLIDAINRQLQTNAMAISEANPKPEERAPKAGPPQELSVIESHQSDALHDGLGTLTEGDEQEQEAGGPLRQATHGSARSNDNVQLGQRRQTASPEVSSTTSKGEGGYQGEQATNTTQNLADAAVADRYTFHNITEHTADRRYVIHDGDSAKSSPRRSENSRSFSKTAKRAAPRGLGKSLDRVRNFKNSLLHEVGGLGSK